MGIQSVTHLNVDFYDKKYILINAKQYDKKSRFLLITCYNHGEIFPLNEGEHSAYIRYRKADNNSVFNFCEIDRKGKITVELTEQMLAADGICHADLVIVNEGGAKVDAQTGEIIGINNTSILSTMPIHIDVTGTAVENSSIESSYEFNGLNTALEKAEAEYTEVMKTAKSWAVGDTGIRDGENTDNAKYYSRQSSNSASAANTSALNAAESERVAGEHKDTAIVHSGNAYTYMTNAKDYMDRAIDAETNAANSANAAKTSETNAKVSETNSKTSESNAKTSETNSSQSEKNAKTSETNALSSEQKAKASETNALTSEQNAKTSEANAAISEDNAKTYMDNAKVSEVNADISETNASNSANKASASESNAKTSEANSKMSETNAKSSETKASVSETNAKASETNALNSANKAQSYAVGGTGTRENEDTNNAYYYYELIKNIVIGLDTGFIPMGTVSFSELANVEKATGYVYNISDDFITDDSFREGAGKSYTAGTNVYYTANGNWDCFGGAASPTATVSEVKEYLGI